MHTLPLLACHFDSEVSAMPHTQMVVHDFGMAVSHGDSPLSAAATPNRPPMRAGRRHAADSLLLASDNAPNPNPPRMPSHEYTH